MNMACFVSSVVLPSCSLVHRASTESFLYHVAAVHTYSIHPQRTPTRLILGSPPGLHRQTGSYRYSLENIESVEGRADHRAGHLWMPVDLFDVLLTLVYKEQLGWHVATTLWCIVHCARFVVVLLDSEIPKCDLIVRTGGGEDRVLSWMPFDRGDGSSVPRE